MAIDNYRPRALLMLFAAAVLVAGLLALVEAKPAWAEQRTFQPAPNSPFAVGSTPTTVTSADFNGDSKVDLAAQNAGSSSVSVLLGNGDGTFQTKSDSAVGFGPTAVISTDFNSDEIADLAVANGNSNSVSILLGKDLNADGKGDGTFQPKQDFPAGFGPTSVISADFNSDQKADLAVANLNSNNVSVLLGNGNGTFQSAQNFANSPPCSSDPCLVLPVAAPNQIIAADFNGDSKLDLATANVGIRDPIFGTFNNPGGVNVLRGNGDGTFQTPREVMRVTSDSIYSITAAHLDAGSSTDLAATRFNSNVVSVLRGNGDGTFQAAQNFGVGLNPSAVTSADLDGDAKADDLAVSNYSSGNVSVLFNNDSGGFQAALNLSAGNGPAFVIGADFNADIFVDLAVANQNSNNVSVLLNKERDTTPPSAPVITSPPNNTIDPDGNFTVSGTAEANSTVELSEGLASRGTATTDASGQWSKSFTGVSDGFHTYTAKARDAAGNLSDPSNPLTVEVRIPPVVVNVSPLDETQNVPVNTSVEATFSEAMNKTSVEAQGTFTLKKQGSTNPVAATVTYDSIAKKATLTPSSSLAWNATYTATIKGGADGAKDLAGNALEADKVWSFTTANDATAPSTAHTLSPLPNAAGWNSSNVTVTLNATDVGGSGLKEIRYSATGAQSIAETVYNPQNPPVINTEGTTTISYFAIDNANNTEQSKTVTVKLDKSAPQITPADVVNSVWRNSSLSQQFSSSDGGSGLANSADASFTLTASAESASATQPTVASRTVLDVAGNSTTRKVSALIDKSAPSSSATATDSAGNDYTSGTLTSKNVTVSLNANDSGASGVKQITYSINGGANQTYNSTNKIPVTSEGTTTISYFATDNAGNTETQPNSFEVRIDKNAPTLDAFTPADRATGVGLNIIPTATFSEQMDRATINTSTIKLYQYNKKKRKWQPITDIALSCDSTCQTAILTPYPPAGDAKGLAANKKYRVTVTTGAKDLSGLSISSPVSWMFTTGRIQG